MNDAPDVELEQVDAFPTHRHLERAVKLGAESVEVVTDSELMARQWSGEYRVRNKALKPLYERAREAAKRIGSIEVRHVRRGENTAADAAANRAIDGGMD